MTCLCGFLVVFLLYDFNDCDQAVTAKEQMALGLGLCSPHRVQGRRVNIDSVGSAVALGPFLINAFCIMEATEIQFHATKAQHSQTFNNNYFSPFASTATHA